VLDTTIPNQTHLNKTRNLLQTIGGKDEPEHRFYVEIVTDITTQNSERKDTEIGQH